MNDLVINKPQLPDNIDDLTQFVLVGKAKLQAYMLKLQTVNKLSVAQEIRDQTLKEAQEISNAVIAAEQRIGELLLEIPTKQGFASAIRDNDVPNAKTKTQTVKEMGYGEREAKDFQQMAKYPEVVQKVMEDALANGEVVTKASVMREIKFYKDRISQLEKQPPKTVKVVPDDYEEIKRQLAIAESDSQRIAEDFKKARKRIIEQDKTVEQLKAQLGADKQIKDADRDIQHFTIATHDYIRRYGGHIWSFEQIQNVNEGTRKDFIKAIKTLDGFAQQLISNIGGNIDG